MAHILDFIQKNIRDFSADQAFFQILMELLVFQQIFVLQFLKVNGNDLFLCDPVFLQPLLKLHQKCRFSAMPDTCDHFDYLFIFPIDELI